MLTQLDQILDRARKRKTRRIAVAAAADLPVLKALKAAANEGVAEPVLIGDRDKIIELAARIGFSLEKYELINVTDAAEAAMKAVAVIKSGDAEILMKGMVATAPFLKAILDKEKGLRKRSVLSHLAVFQTSYYHKLLGATDAAMNIAPTLEEKISIIENAVEVFHLLGIPNPKVAALGPVEVVNEKIPSTVDAANLKKMNLDGRINGCLIDGPFAVDNAVSSEAAHHKGIVSEVAGDADILLAPGLDAGNILYKTMMFLSDGRSAAIITGASAPVVLTSRADSEESKLYSIALAAAL
jgi:phosphate butyryltransferase